MIAADRPKENRIQSPGNEKWPTHGTPKASLEKRDFTSRV
jgi:hypothetical protein